ncbi:TPA: tail fiber protein [Escherichia coli]|nr:tail fiber protein [Escherichia coli]HDD9400571.1 tail fiber protein [Escherichia coli]
MGNLNETEKWEENIYQLETSDPVLGGADGISNRAPRQLANRTKWLKKKTEEAAQSLAEHVRSRNHPDATLTAKGFTQLSSATNSTSETLAATPKAVKAAYDLAAGKAPVSHTHPWSQITGVPAASLTAKGTVQLSSATDSQSETEAATPKAVKIAYDLARGKYTAQDATTTRKGIVQLSSATNSTSETLAATPKAVKAAYDLAAGKAPVSHTHPWSQITGVPAASLTAKGTVQLSSAINSTSEILAATPKAVKAAYDLANGKQPADATLTALAGLATAADRLPYFTGADRAALATLTAIGRAIIAKGSIKDVLNYLGLRELGTSGEKIPLLSTANTWTNRQTFSGGLSGELSGNASTAAKLKTARKISNVAFDGSSDITLKASHVGAFALGKTGSTVANDKAVGWNWSSGAYNATISGASTLIIHFYMGEGSCPAAQFRINYKNGGIFYRSARDGYGFEADWSEFYTTTRKPSAGDVGAYTKAECNSRFITGVRLGGLSSVQTWNGPGWSDKSGYVVTGSVNGNRDELIDTTQARPIQYCINGTWYNAGSI